MHLGVGHDCGIVSDSVSGSVPEASPGTSHSVCSCDTHPAGVRNFAVHSRAEWLILFMCCGDFCLWLSGIRTSHFCRTSSEDELVLHLCDRGKKNHHHSSAQPADNLAWQQVKKRETTMSSRLALLFFESDKKLSR